MAHLDVVAYNIAAFICSLFVLEFGADKFIDHTAVLARRTGISETVVGLLTAGAEWEELAVVIASLARGRSSLALGNIIGATISNILGAFSLGLLFHDEHEAINFDRSSRIYSLVLLVLSTFAICIVYQPGALLWTIAGSVLIAFFAVYIVLVANSIGRGLLTAPEGSDSDSDSDSESEFSSDLDSVHDVGPDGLAAARDTGLATAETPLLPTSLGVAGRRRHTLRYHAAQLLMGFLAICLAGYILSQAATNITDQFGVSDVLFGVVILAIATTIPEKFVALMSGHRGRTGILVANTVGSNIFLLSLCVGIIMVDTQGALDGSGVTLAELVVLWASTLGMTLTVWFGGRACRWTGALMLLGYVGFIVAEFTVVRRDLS